MLFPDSKSLKSLALDVTTCCGELFLSSSQISQLLARIKTEQASNTALVGKGLIGTFVNKLNIDQHEMVFEQILSFLHLQNDKIEKLTRKLAQTMNLFSTAEAESLRDYYIMKLMLTVMEMNREEKKLEESEEERRDDLLDTFEIAAKNALRCITIMAPKLKVRTLRYIMDNLLTLLKKSDNWYLLHLEISSFIKESWSRFDSGYQNQLSQSLKDLFSSHLKSVSTLFCITILSSFVDSISDPMKRKWMKVIQKDMSHDLESSHDFHFGDYFFPVLRSLMPVMTPAQLNEIIALLDKNFITPLPPEPDAKLEDDQLPDTVLRNGSFIWKLIIFFPKEQRTSWAFKLVNDKYINFDLTRQEVSSETAQLLDECVTNEVIEQAMTNKLKKRWEKPLFFCFFADKLNINQLRAIFETSPDVFRRHPYGCIPLLSKSNLVSAYLNRMQEIGMGFQEISTSLSDFYIKQVYAEYPENIRFYKFMMKAIKNRFGEEAMKEWEAKMISSIFSRFFWDNAQGSEFALSKLEFSSEPIQKKAALSPWFWVNFATLDFLHPVMVLLSKRVLTDGDWKAVLLILKAKINNDHLILFLEVFIKKTLPLFPPVLEPTQESIAKENAAPSKKRLASSLGESFFENGDRSSKKMKTEEENGMDVEQEKSVTRPPSP